MRYSTLWGGAWRPTFEVGAQSASITSMDHLEAIDAGLTAKQPYNEIARKVFLTYPTKAFVGNEERQYEILNSVAEYFRVPITSIQVAGSAKLGQSVHKKTAFIPGQSDLDLAIIDSHLFAWYLQPESVTHFG